MVVDDTVWKYRRGGCFAMAAALSRLTGHPVRHIETGMFVHAFVLNGQNEVIDIHGRMPWDDFVSFLVVEKAFTQDMVDRGLVVAKELDEHTQHVWSTLFRYKPPSETAIKKAISVAKKHPNTAPLLA